MSVLPKNMTQCPRPGLENGLLYWEMSTLSMGPACLPFFFSFPSVTLTCKLLISLELNYIYVWIFIQETKGADTKSMKTMLTPHLGHTLML